MKIEIENLLPSYMDITEVADSEIYLQPNIQFESPKKYLIEARSGRGKTSLFSIIYGSLKNYNGVVSKTQDSDSTAIWRTKLSCVFQDLKLFPELSAMENVLIKNQLTQHKSIDEIESLFDQLGMGMKKSNLVSELSQGQKQRVAIIRALCQPFEFLLLDEPFSHLDETNIKIAIQLISHELEIQHGGLLLMSLEDNDLFNYDKKYNL